MALKRTLIIGCSGLMMSLAVGSGIASAAPEDAIVNSTCTYPQVMAALNAESPAAAQLVNENPMAAGWIQSLVAAPPDQRRAMIQQAQRMPAVQAYSGVISGVVNTCNNY